MKSPEGIHSITCEKCGFHATSIPGLTENSRIIADLFIAQSHSHCKGKLVRTPIELPTKKEPTRSAAVK